MKREDLTEEEKEIFDKLPAYIDKDTLTHEFFEPIDPYADPPKCGVNLLAMSRYAREHNKKIVDLTKEEFDQFMIDTES